MMLVFPLRVDGWVSDPEEENLGYTDLGGAFQQFLRWSLSVSGDSSFPLSLTVSMSPFKSLPNPLTVSEVCSAGAASR
eukprot:10818581-Ditylum_brightwellii.AAC.1